MAQLLRQSYGKHQVRVSKIKRFVANDQTRHELVEFTVSVELDGEFEAAYTRADNSLVIATDTCRNTVYVLAKDDPLDSIEAFGLTIAQHFLKQYGHVTQAKVCLEEHCWHRLNDCAHAFQGNDSSIPAVSILAQRTPQDSITVAVESGLKNCLIAKTTASGFANFHRDSYRTLPDTDDRILATNMTAWWTHRDATQDHDFKKIRADVCNQLLATFVDHYSHSVQETLFRMGQAVLNACPTIERIALTMPNKHHIRFNLEPFQRQNENEVFVVTDEPFGFISATISR